MKNRSADYLSCPKCHKISKRIFEFYLNEKRLETLPAFIILDWIGCAQKNCRNLFSKNKSISRCPVCHLWSVKLKSSGELQNWQCNNGECKWEITLPSLK